MPTLGMSPQHNFSRDVYENFMFISQSLSQDQGDGVFGVQRNFRRDLDFEVTGQDVISPL